MTNTKLAWWSGLTVAAPAGIHAVRSELEHETYDGQIYWYAEPPSARYGGDSA